MYSNHEMVFHQPNNFEVNNNLPNKRLKDKHNEKYKAVVSMLVEASMNRRDLPEDAFYYIRGEVLSRLLTSRHFRTILDDLKSGGIIECDGQYIPGQKTLGYRLVSEFRSAPTEVVRIKDAKIAQKLETVRKNDFGKGFTDSVLDQYLLNNFNRLRLTSSQSNGGLSEVTEAEDRSVNTGHRCPIDPAHDLVVFDHSKGYGSGNNNKPILLSQKCEIIRCRLLMMLMLLCGYSSYACSASFYILNNTSSNNNNNNTTPYDFTFQDIEQYCQYHKVQACLSDGEAPPDGKAHMQYLKSIESNWDNGKLFITRSIKTGRIYSSLTNLPKSLRSRLTIDTGEQLVMLDICNSQPFLFNVLLKQYYQSAILPSDVMEYIQLTSQGMLYEKLMKEFGVKDREKFKREFFGSVFFSDTIAYMTENAKKFEKLFPNVFKVIQHHKRNDFRQLSWRLQQAESKLIIDQVCGRLQAENLPDLFVATIHDCVMVNAKYQELAQEIIKEEFKRTGLNPTLKLEPVS